MSTARSMRALVFEGPGRLTLRQVPRPVPGPGEVLVRVGAATICGTDVRIVAGRKTRDVRRGHPIGHECAGVVADVGPGVAGIAPGRRVGVCVVVSCGQCASCGSGRENLCESRITLGYHTDGAFADAMLIPGRAVTRGNLFSLPASVSSMEAALLEPTACCINGQHEMGLGARGGDLARPESLVIFGAGPIGLLHLLVARAGLPASDQSGQPEPARTGTAAVGPITVVEPSPHRRGFAAQFGADHVCAPQDLAREPQFDAAILAVGQTDLVPLALSVVRPAGKVNLFAGFDPGAEACIDPNLIHYRQLHVTGASESRRRDYAEALALVAQQRVDLTRLLTHRFPLEAYDEAFCRATDGSALKVGFDMDAGREA